MGTHTPSQKTHDKHCRNIKTSYGNFEDVYKNNNRNTLLKRSFKPSVVGFLEEERFLAGMVRADFSEGVERELDFKK